MLSPNIGILKKLQNYPTRIVPTIDLDTIIINTYNNFSNDFG